MYCFHFLYLLSLTRCIEAGGFQLVFACCLIVPFHVVYSGWWWKALLFPPKGTGISCSNLRLAWPVVCFTGKSSQLGSLRSFPEPFFFLSISYFLDNSRRPPLPTMDLVHSSTKHILTSKSWAISCKNWAKFPICCCFFQLVSVW